MHFTTAGRFTGPLIDRLQRIGHGVRPGGTVRDAPMLSSAIRDQPAGESHDATFVYPSTGPAGIAIDVATCVALAM